VKPYIIKAHDRDEVILSEFFGLVDKSLTTPLPLSEKVFVFITNNVKHYGTNVASATTNCISQMLRELDLEGQYTPQIGIYDINWLETRLKMIMKRFSNGLQTGKGNAL